MTILTRGLSAAAGTAALVLGVAATPAAAQFEPALPRTEDDDAIDIAVTPDGSEWWVAEIDGQVATAPLGEPQVTCPPPQLPRGYVRAIDRTPSGEGYWLATTYGEVLTCGDAEHLGDLPSLGITPDQPIVGIAATPDGDGYWLAGEDGGVFAFGAAPFRGSAGDLPLNAPVVGMDAAGDAGYWLVATDGGVFTYGDADFHGSAGDIPLNKPVVGMTRSGTGSGYLLLGEDGGVFAYGDARFHGSRWSQDDAEGHQAPFVGIDHAGGGDGYMATDNTGTVLTFGEIGGGVPADPEVVDQTDGFPGTGPPALLTDVDVAGHDGYDRFVFQFGDTLPEHRVSFVEGPIRQQPSSMPIDVAGTAHLEVTAAAASGVDLSGSEPVQTYTGPDRIAAPGTEVITEAVEVEDFENHLSWVVGLDSRTEVDVSTLDDPARIVVDVRHP